MPKARLLAESEEHHRIISEMSLDAIITIDASGVVVNFNPAAETIFGFRSEDICGLELAQTIIPPSLRRKYHAGFQRFLETGKSEILGQRIEIMAIRANGDEFPVELMVTPYTVDGVQFFTGVLRDITERKKAEQALVESEDRFRTFAETSSDWFWEMDENLRFIFFSERFSEISGIKKEELLGKTRQQSGLDQTDRRLDQNIEDLEAHRAFKNFEHSRVRGDGSVVHMSTSGTPIFDDDGVFKGYRGVGTDITERMMAEQNWRKSEEQFKDFARSTGDRFWQTDEEHRMEKISDQNENTPEFTVHPLGKRRWEVEGASSDDNWKAMKDAMEAHKPFSDCPVTLVRDGKESHRRTSGVPVFDDDGNFKGYRGTSRDVTEDVRRERSLKESEENYRRIFEDSGVGMATNELDGRFLRVNKAFCTMLGYSEQELLLKTVYDITFEADLLQTRETRANVVADGRQMDTFEKRFVRKDGKVIWGLLNRSLIKDGNGQSLYFESQIQDISERKLSEAAKATSEARFKDFTSSAADRFWETNAEFQYVYVSDPKRNLTNPVSNLLGKTPWEIDGSNENLPGLLELKQKFEKFEPVDNVEYFWVNPSGKATYISISAVPYKDANGVFQGYRGVSIDRTSERQAEQRYRQLFEQANDGIVLLTVDTQIIIDCNEVFAASLGYSREELIGESIGKFSPMQRTAERARRVANLKPGENDVIERVHLKKDGAEYPVEISSSSIDVNGRKLMLSFVRDITLRKNSEEILKEAHNQLEKRVEERTADLSKEVERRKGIEAGLIEANLAAQSDTRAKSEFLANMSHELRTPLNAIIGFSETLSEKVFGPLGNAKQEEYIGNIHDSGLHLLDLINDILDVSAIEADKLEFDETNVDMGEVVDASLLLIESRAKQDGVAIINTINRLKFTVLADERRMKQVLVNLLSNAVKFNKVGGTVTVGVETTNEGSAIIIADTGIGMSAEEIAHAMEPFQQIRRGDKHMHEGTGLGLPLTKKLVEAQGGTLSIESKPGYGTTVKVEFPNHKIVMSAQDNSR